ncbi:flagellar protein FlhE [Halomonas sp. E14]|uniref:flagellar protein FlhE n=1 Tax=Halomonas sp. E14 TaxID=3397245 RepID=UPI00403EA270
MSRRLVLAALVGLVAAQASSVQAAGSWVATAPAVQVAMADRQIASAALQPPSPALAQGQVIRRIGWQYQAPPGAAVDAWLCHPDTCMRLPGARGHSEALAGLPADAALHFHFSLQDARQRIATLQGLQVIVDHERR